MTGPDNPRFDYSAIIDRPALRWPGGARLALCIVPNIEFFHYGLPGTSVNERSAQFPPDVINYSWREYGSRVGVWRLMECLDAHRLRATVALNAEVCLYRARIVEEGLARGWEFMGHGMTNSRRHVGMSADEERGEIGRTLEIIGEATGRRPQGWLGPGLLETDRTLDLLAEAGVTYVCDWVADDQPFLLRSTNGPVVALPYSVDVNDIGLFLRQGLTGAEFARMLRDQFDTLYAESQRTAKVMTISLHPFLTGQPYRIAYLDRALRYILSHVGVWAATGGEIVSAYLGSPA